MSTGLKENSLPITCRKPQRLTRKPNTYSVYALFSFCLLILFLFWGLQNEWVICRVFQKSAGGKKIPISSLIRIGSLGTDFNPSLLPSLTDSSPYNDKTKTEPVYVPCFSNQTDQNQGTTLNCFSSPVLNSIQADIFHRIPLYQTQSLQVSTNLQSPVLTQEHSVLHAMIENNRRQSLKTMSVSQETGVSTDMNTDISSDFEFGKRRFDSQEDPSSSTGPVDLEPFWNY